MEGVGNESHIPLPNVTGKILAKVIEYCKYHLEHPTPISEEKKDEKRTDDIIPWDQEFCKVDQATLFELILVRISIIIICINLFGYDILQLMEYSPYVNGLSSHF